MLAAELAIEILAQFDGQLIRGAEKQYAPDIAQQIDHHRNNDQQADPHPHLFRGVMLFCYAVNHDTHHLWRHQLQNGNDDQQSNSAEVTTPLPAEIPAKLGK